MFFPPFFSPPFLSFFLVCVKVVFYTPICVVALIINMLRCCEISNRCCECKIACCKIQKWCCKSLFRCCCAHYHLFMKLSHPLHFYTHLATPPTPPPVSLPAKPNLLRPGGVDPQISRATLTSQAKPGSQPKQLTNQNQFSASFGTNARRKPF